MLANIDVGSIASLDEQEIADYADAMETVFANWQAIDLSENRVRQLYLELLRHIDKDARHRGEYKTQANQVEAFDTDGLKIGPGCADGLVQPIRKSSAFIPATAIPTAVNNLRVMRSSKSFMSLRVSARSSLISPLNSARSSRISLFVASSPLGGMASAAATACSSETPALLKAS